MEHKYRAMVDYSAISPNGNFIGASKAWKPRAESIEDALQQVLKLLRERISKEINDPNAEITRLQIDCRIMENPEATYKRVVGEE